MFKKVSEIMKKFISVLAAILSLIMLSSCGKTVTITFPASFFEGEDSDALIKQFKSGDGNKKVKQNEDGTVTLVVTEKKYDLIVENIESTIESMYETIGQEDSFFQTVEKFEHNDDYTDLKITVDREAFEKSDEPKSVEQIIYVARLYQVYALQNDKVITLTYIDSATGQAYEEDQYTSAGKIIDKTVG